MALVNNPKRFIAWVNGEISYHELALYAPESCHIYDSQDPDTSWGEKTNGSIIWYDKPYGRTPKEFQAALLLLKD